MQLAEILHLISNRSFRELYIEFAHTTLCCDIL